MTTLLCALLYSCASLSLADAESILERHELVKHLLENLYMKLPNAYTNQEDLLAHVDLLQGQVDEDGAIHYFDKPPQRSMLDTSQTYLSGITYAEVASEHMYEITGAALQVCNLSAADGEFWDIGSGDGKVVIQQFLERDFSRVVGVELVKRRFDIAVDALKELQSAIKAEANNTVIQFLRNRFGTDQPVIFEGTWSGTNMSSICLGEANNFLKDGRQICFIHGDATEIAADSGVEEAVMVYTASQCFADNDLKNLTDNTFKHMQAGATLVSFKELPKMHANSVGLIDVETLFKKVYAHSKEEQPVYVYKHHPDDALVPSSVVEKPQMAGEKK